MHSYTSHFIPRYLPQKNENESAKSYTWMFIAIYVKWLKPHNNLTIHQQLDCTTIKWIVVQPHNVLLLSNKKEATTWMNLRMVTLNKKSQTPSPTKKDYILQWESDPSLAPGQLGTGPHIRRGAVVEQGKLHLPLPITHITAWIIPPPQNQSLVPKMLETIAP